jgi:hypothetical protein
VLCTPPATGGAGGAGPCTLMPDTRAFWCMARSPGLHPPGLPRDPSFGPLRGTSFWASSEDHIMCTKSAQKCTKTRKFVFLWSSRSSSDPGMTPHLGS